MNQTAGMTAADGLRGARALDPKYYVGDAMHELERQWVFGRSWQWVAHRAELAEAGDHVPGRLFPRREAGMWHFHQHLRAAYKAAG